VDFDGYLWLRVVFCKIERLVQEKLGLQVIMKGPIADEPRSACDDE